jgi:hypothetical protein
MEGKDNNYYSAWSLMHKADFLIFALVTNDIMINFEQAG